MKLIENIALAFAAFLCVGVMEMAVAAAGAALEVWRESRDEQQAGNTEGD